MTYWKESNACIKHCTELNTGVTINTYLISDGQYSGHILSCLKSVEHYPKTVTKLWLKTSSGQCSWPSDLLSSLSMKIISDTFDSVFFIFVVEEIWPYSPGGWWWGVLPSDSRTACFYYVLLYRLPTPSHEYVDREQPECEQWCWERH